MTGLRRRFHAAQQIVILLMLIAFGFALGSSYPNSSFVNAEIRKSPPRQAFQTGAERSEVHLKEISATLKRIESRLDQMSRKMDSPPQP